MVAIQKELNKTGFVLLESLTALMIASVCVYLVSFGQLFLLQAEKKSGEELLFIRMIYEDIKTQRMYHKRPERREEMIPYDIQIVDNNGVIEKVFVNMEKEAISIEKQVIPAFTLIECLIGLMILSSLLLTFNLLIQQTIQVSEFLQRKDQKEWLIFLAQLEEELKSSHNVSVKNQQLHYTIEDKQYIIERYQAMIRKRRTSGGHQPMLTSITELQLLEKEHTISFYVHFENGEDGYAIWTKNDQ